ncbi:probable rRNA-processing protein EBP2 homolog [Penaeus japonicus]|uniref:probable rRNA-processing protein EBP2 homolog n=1 Tax=Penaeus japonicus TaxID=27405 RepID=UPI001C70FAF2|nr:probable rRNA-processing protein EBP2 homolog [Penaeus japonicus]XP_042870361.1 probable rRNA-processing protein EBP2 homolog [Penaeus japonicus]
MVMESDTESDLSEQEFSDYEEVISDEDESDSELQRAFERGDIKPGLNFVEEIDKGRKEKKNDVTGLQRKLKEFEQKLPWIERLEFTNTPAPLAPELDVEIAEHARTRENRMRGTMKNFNLDDDPIHNDFKREMIFYRQAQQAVLDGYERLTKLDRPTLRPDDYFAEMAKSDVHMQKVRRRLMNKKAGQEMSEKVKKIREIKKFGKKVQIEREQQKHKEKREMLEKVKQFRKGKTNTIDFLSNKPLREDRNRVDGKKSNLRRAMKDKKYGKGGVRRNQKRNNGEDLDDRPGRGFQKGGNKKGAKGGKNAAKMRPGKRRRQQMKSR